jgi:hypothetical protein
MGGAKVAGIFIKVETFLSHTKEVIGHTCTRGTTEKKQLKKVLV